MPKWIDQFDGRLDVDPPVADETLATVPSGRGVVALLAEGDEPIILLTAARLRARLRGRLSEPLENAGPQRRADLRQITRAVLWTRAGSHFEADLSYLELARQIWPRRYTQMLAWKPAWLVAVDAEDAAPHFVRTRDIRVSRRKFGPFPSGKAAEAFIAAIQDAFDLCRNVRCLRQAPDAAPCAYAQMGRCLSPCDGTISMSLYREVVRRAADCAAGDREPIRRQLHEEMNAAAKELAFERAATIKTRLERLAELDAPAYRHVAPLGQICYIVLQPSRSRRQVRAFLARGGNIADAGRLDWPLDDKQLTRLLEATGRHAEAPLADDAAGGWRFGLVAHYLHAGETKRGVFVRWREDLTPQRVGRIIEDNSKLLRLSQRKTKPGSSKSDEP